MLAPVLQRPLLLDTPWAASIDGTETFAAHLAPRFVLHDLEPIHSRVDHKGPLRLQMAAADLGEVAFTSVLGDPLTFAVDPLHPLCLLALPAAGWGQYQLDDQRIDNSVGQSVAYLPPCGWRLINDNTAGTGIQFRAEALISRIEAISAGALEAPRLKALLATPFVVDTTEARNCYYYRHLLAALDLVDSSFRHGPGQPDPMLCLDDLILRCVALLLHPTLAERDAQRTLNLAQSDLRSCVQGLMEWIRANLHRPLSLSDIEQEAGYGRRAIQLGFKAEVGCGPMQWVRRQRLELARQRLSDAEPGVTVTQVAQACGYISLSSFSRDFQQRYGRSARQLLMESRRQHRQP